MKIFKVIVFLLISTSTYSHQLVIDTTFNTFRLDSLSPNGPTLISLNGPNNTVLATVIQTDGKIIIGGRFTKYNNNTANRIARLNEDGSIDTTFKVGSGADEEVSQIKVLSSGKIMIGGKFKMIDGKSHWACARLNINGSVDTTYKWNYPSNEVHDPYWLIAFSATGKTLIGISHGEDPFDKDRLRLLQSNGDVDTSFYVKEILDPYGNGNTIVTKGSVNQFPGQYSIEEVGFNLVGKPLITHSFLTLGGGVGVFSQYNLDGRLDTTFSFSNEISGYQIQQDGGILSYFNYWPYGADITGYGASISLHDSGGVYDQNFISSGHKHTEFSVVSQLSDSTVVASGRTNALDLPNYIYAELDSAGAIDTNLTFPKRTHVNNWYGGSSSVIIEQPDGKILCSGHFNNIEGQNNIIRLIRKKTVVSVLEEELASSMNLYPNPANELIMVSLFSKAESMVALLVSDVSGINVMRKNFVISKGENNLRLNVSSLNSGIYLVQIGQEGLVRKFIKL
jgi:uncharacterized delta-60 repeat protein